MYPSIACFSTRGLDLVASTHKALSLVTTSPLFLLSGKGGCSRYARKEIDGGNAGVTGEAEIGAPRLRYADFHVRRITTGHACAKQRECQHDRVPTGSRNHSNIRLARRHPAAHIAPTYGSAGAVIDNYGHSYDEPMDLQAPAGRASRNQA